MASRGILFCMIQRFSYKDSVWIDLNQPTDEEVRAVMSEFSINPTVVQELTSPSFKSRVELHREYIYLILHFPAFKHSHTLESKQEVDFIIGKNFLITTRYDTIDALEKFSKVVEVKSILDRGFEGDTTGAMFFGILGEIYQSLLHELEYTDTAINKIEDGIFNGRERQMVRSLSELSRDLLNFKKATDFHREVLKTLKEFGMQIFDGQFAYHVDRIIHEYSKVENTLRNNRDALTELRATNDSLLSARENEIGKTLTIMASIFLPLSLIASAFGMNTSFTPFVEEKNGFWIIAGLMTLSAFLTYVFFKFKRWI
jgi:magnesium transporter